MTNSRHFENSFISLSQPRIIRFRSNLVYGCEFPFRGWIFDRKSKFRKFKTADGRHIENRFWLYLGAILADVCESWTADVESHANRGHMSETAIFDNSTWRQPLC